MKNYLLNFKMYKYKQIYKAYKTVLEEMENN